MNYGSAYKQIRKSKKLSQNDVCGNFMSRSTLSKFENNLLCPTLEIFFYLLNQIDMNFDEFSFIANNYKLDTRKAILKDFIELKNNSEDLNNLLRRCNEYLEECEDYSIQSIHSVIDALSLIRENKTKKIECRSKIVVNDIWIHMSSSDEWFLFDFQLLNNILFYFPINTALDIGQEIQNKLKTFNSYRSTDTLRASIYLNLSILFLHAEKKEDSFNLATQAELIAKEIKRYDFLLMAKLRKAISSDNIDGINKVLQSLLFLEDDTLSNAVKEEVSFFGYYYLYSK